MSADNYHLIRRAGDRYAVSMEFASSEDHDHPTGRLGHPAPIDAPNVVWFDTLEDARAACDADWTEYGTVEDVDHDAAGDTLLNRRISVARDVADAWEVTSSGGTTDHVAIDLADGTRITIAGPDAWALHSWLLATSPDALAAHAPAADQPGPAPSH